MKVFSLFITSNCTQHTLLKRILPVPVLSLSLTHFHFQANSAAFVLPVFQSHSLTQSVRGLNSRSSVVSVLSVRVPRSSRSAFLINQQPKRTWTNSPNSLGLPSAIITISVKTGGRIRRTRVNHFGSQPIWTGIQHIPILPRSPPTMQYIYEWIKTHSVIVL